MNKTSKKRVEIGKYKELSSADESIDDRDVEEAQPDLTTVMTTEELDFWSNYDSEAGASLDQSETINGLKSDRVADRYADPPVEYMSPKNRGISEN